MSSSSPEPPPPLPRIRLYNVFHHRIFDELAAAVPTDERANLVFFGVNEQYDKEYNRDAGHVVQLEWTLPHYRPELQQTGYCQTTCMYHVYQNDLHADLDYIGFLQYDQRIPADLFARIRQRAAAETAPSVIFYSLGLTMKQTLRHCRGLADRFAEAPSALEHYNAFFGTAFTAAAFTDATPLPYVHTFVIPREMFERMMAWISAYLDDVLTPPGAVWPSNMSHPEFLERCHGMFLALEKIRRPREVAMVSIAIPHEQTYRSRVDTFGYWTKYTAPKEYARNQKRAPAPTALETAAAIRKAAEMRRDAAARGPKRFGPTPIPVSDP